MDAKAKTVLIVEDMKLNMKLFHICSMLTVTIFCQTKTAWKRSISAREHTDLILMESSCRRFRASKSQVAQGRRFAQSHPGRGRHAFP